MWLERARPVQGSTEWGAVGGYEDTEPRCQRSRPKLCSLCFLQASSSGSHFSSRHKSDEAIGHTHILIGYPRVSTLNSLAALSVAVFVVPGSYSVQTRLVAHAVPVGELQPTRPSREASRRHRRLEPPAEAQWQHREKESRPTRISPRTRHMPLLYLLRAVAWPPPPPPPATFL
ncbi:hypothetical protein CERZMDRAFT_87162 [Cercospora zeae-maydis SCOH1-5]|uniref:Uncharacterized protein n=1 Tax=Cercospora zeae-maydis SCOH1-5 TaxID=717836 RepID=A0A6A6F7A5_9PEZI|nr:hypothetical protein CERZMDRAFT_87162 [Cercospora zeae-maydis SCOH1-5]